MPLARLGRRGALEEAPRRSVYGWQKRAGQLASHGGRSWRDVALLKGVAGNRIRERHQSVNNLIISISSPCQRLA